MVPQWLILPLWLLLIFASCATISLLFCFIARVLFPRFRSGEFKPGPHRSDIRSDLPAGGREIKTIELPLVGGPAFILALILTGIASGFLLNFNHDQWTLLLIGLGATFAYMLVGFLDDCFKVFSNEGLSERSKLIGLLLVSIAAALFYFFLLPKSGSQSYTPYTDLPIIGSLLCPVPHSGLSSCPVIPHFGQPAYFASLILLILITSVIGTVTSLSVDFSDGIDGLAGGLVFSAALAFGIIITGNLDPHHPEGIVLEVMALLCAASALGFLPMNWPSSWAARRGTSRRRAKIYMGDSGALGLGGILAMIAIFFRQESLLLLIGGAFVLEGLSALMSAKVLTPFFRKRLLMLRYASTSVPVHHTEFPKPFLATPLHHHFDLIGWDRRRLVYGAWALGACFAALGVMVGKAPETWERYLARILVLILAWLVWSSGSWTRRYFVGKHPADRMRRRRLALFYGYPYQVIGLRLYHLVEIIEASENVIETPSEELALWQRMNIYDARAMLGLYCYRAGYFPAALAQWTRIPLENRALRPEIERLRIEVENRIALEKQETQPMRLDQILRSSPVISGNLPPADLPNPHEPIRIEETRDGLRGWTTTPANSSLNGDDNDDEERQITSPLRSDAASNGSASSAPLRYATPPPAERNWLVRFLRLAPGKGD
jgi:UDP-N-acetylmuramyl pentapeptide phosphotransferase/UDP-N-acetylglucosamine-1-phosphate transferase